MQLLRHCVRKSSFVGNVLLHEVRIRPGLLSILSSLAELRYEYAKLNIFVNNVLNTKYMCYNNMSNISSNTG